MQLDFRDVLNRLWEDGWKERYYLGKFSVGPEDREFRHKVVSHGCSPGLNSA